MFLLCKHVSLTCGFNKLMMMMMMMTCYVKRCQLFVIVMFRTFVAHIPGPNSRVGKTRPGESLVLSFFSNPAILSVIFTSGKEFICSSVSVCLFVNRITQKLVFMNFYVMVGHNPRTN